MLLQARLPEPGSADSRDAAQTPGRWQYRLRRRARPGLFALAVFTACAPAIAADGNVLLVDGQVMLERTSPGVFSIAPVSVGAEIRGGDLIRTSSNGRAQIRFRDGSIVSLQPGTALRIDEYRFEPDDRRAFFYLLRGALRTVTGTIGKTNHDEYRMKTPTATVGVRGTEYVAEQTVCDPRCAPGDRAGLRVAVTHGRIIVTNDAGSIEVSTGQAASVDSADAAPKPAEHGPVLPPISQSAPRERPAGAARTTAASAAAANDATGSSIAPDGATAPARKRQATDPGAFDPASRPVDRQRPPNVKTPPDVKSPHGMKPPQGVRTAHDIGENPSEKTASGAVNDPIDTRPRYVASQTPSATGSGFVYRITGSRDGSTISGLRGFGKKTPGE